MATAASRRRITRWPTTWADELATLLPLLLVLVGGFWYAAAHEAQPGDLARASALLVLTQTLPGMVVWRSVRPVSGWLVEDIVMGTAVGAAIAIPGQVIGVRLDQPGFRWALPLAVAFLVVFLPWSRRRVLRAEWYRLPLSWGWVVALASVGSLALSTRPFSQVLPGHAAWATQYIDVPYHVAMTAELEHRFPPVTPWVVSESLDYHWFSHAWLGNLAGLLGVPNDMLVTRWAPVLLGVLTVVALACLGTRLGGPATGAVAAVGVVLVRQVPTYTSWNLLSLFTPISPSTGFALLVGTAAVTLLVVRWRGESPRWAVLVLALLAVTAGGAKGSWLPMLAAGCLVAAGVALVSRSRFARRVLLDAAVVGAALLAAVLLLFRGNSGDARLVPLRALADASGHAVAVPPSVGGWPMPDVIGVTVVLVLMALLPLVGVVGLVRGGAWRDGAGALLVGSFLAGLGLTMVFDHPGKGHLYFYQAALPLGVVAASWGLTRLVTYRRRSLRGWLLALLGAVVGWALLGPLRDVVPGGERTVAGGLEVLAFVTFAVLVLGVAVRGLHPRAGTIVLAAGLAGASTVGMISTIAEQPFRERVIPATEPVLDASGVPLRIRPHNGAVSAGQWQAMRWIALNTDPGDLVMTNRHCWSPGGPCNNRRFWLAAYSERRVLVEGWGYTRRSEAAAARDRARAEAAGVETPQRPNLQPFWDPRLLALNDLLYQHPGEAIARALYDRGVRWVYAERSSGLHPGLATVAEEVYANEDAVVYRLRGGEGE